MRIALFSPYGNFPDTDLISANFIFLLASYLVHRKSEVFAIKCDGCLERCSLDLYTVGNSKRPCLACMNSQKGLNAWANLSEQVLSNFLSAEELKKINQHFSDLSFLQNSLPAGGSELLQKYSECQNADHIQISKLQKSALFLSAAIRKLVQELKPKLLLTHSKQDLLTGMVALAFAEQGVTIASYQSNETQDGLELTTNKASQSLNFPFYSSSIEHFRSDPNTWDDHLREAILQNISFLGLQSNQLSFYI